LRSRIILAVVPAAALVFAGIGTAQAVPTAGDKAGNHGQCVSQSAQPAGKGGRSATARPGGSCTVPATLTCVENEALPGTVVRDSSQDTVTIAGSPGTDGSSLECDTAIVVNQGDIISFTYALGEGTAPCGGGVPRMFVAIDGAYSNPIDGTRYNTIDGDPECSQADGNTVTYVLPAGGTVTQVGFVYDRGDTGSVTYSNAKVGGVSLNI